MSFLEVQFPVTVSFGSSGGPGFNTEVVILGSGHEQRNIKWAASRARYDAATGVKDLTTLAAVIAFFQTCRGRAHGFRWKDWTNYTATAEAIGTGDGSDLTFQLVKTDTYGGESYIRTITKPVAGTVHVYVAGVEQVGNWTVNTATGLVTFAGGHAPGIGAAVTATFEFDVPCRFDTDALSLVIDDYQVGSAQIPIVEVRV